MRSHGTTPRGRRKGIFLSSDLRVAEPARSAPRATARRETGKVARREGFAGELRSPSASPALLAREPPTLRFEELGRNQNNQTELDGCRSRGDGENGGRRHVWNREPPAGFGRAWGAGGGRRDDCGPGSLRASRRQRFQWGSFFLRSNSRGCGFLRSIHRAGSRRAAHELCSRATRSACPVAPISV